jgi:hypothetical protein
VTTSPRRKPRRSAEAAVTSAVTERIEQERHAAEEGRVLEEPV